LSLWLLRLCTRKLPAREGLNGFPRRQRSPLLLMWLYIFDRGAGEGHYNVCIGAILLHGHETDDSSVDS
jgi:hypothetical protein